MHGVQHCKLLHRDDLAGRLIRHIRLRQCLHFSKAETVPEKKTRKMPKMSPLASPNSKIGDSTGDYGILLGAN